MYATCMWLVQLLLVLSKRDPLFSYIPEFYVETLVDSFHALRRSDPPFVSPSSLLQQGLSPLVICYIFLIFSVILVSLRWGMNSILMNSLCLFFAQVMFLVTHFSDVRIVNSDIRDIILQSISVLVQYKEHVVAFERSQAAREGMVGSLLASFDNRFWIPVSNILLRLCKGSGFGASKCSSHGESFSPHFQRLLKEKCIVDEKLFASFLNRLFNTLNWTITEFSVAIKEMQENVDRHQVQDLQQRKCTIMFELSCNLERILEFFTQELPQAFLQGPEMNLIRLCELIIFVLNHTTCSADALFFDSTVRQQGQSQEKVNRAMILAPLVGIVLNLRNATTVPNHGMTYDLAHAIVSVDISAAVISNFQYLINYSWVRVVMNLMVVMKVSLSATQCL
jgi:Kip1 ubiquitination-promoting complex protein 1